MRTSDFKANAIRKAAVLVALILLFGAGASFAQQQVNLTAAPAGITLPDGNAVPMWGYKCGTLATGVTSTATCAYLSGAASPAALGALGAISVVNGGSRLHRPQATPPPLPPVRWPWLPTAKW